MLTSCARARPAQDRQRQAPVIALAGRVLPCGRAATSPQPAQAPGGPASGRPCDAAAAKFGIIEYPDSDKIGVWGRHDESLDHVIRRSPELD